MLLLSAGIENAVPLFIALVIAFAYHEFGHAIVADRLGDPTPRQNGRITLNPIPHLSLIGLIMLVVAGFGWATTPVTPSYLRGNIRRSYAIVSVAGPAANLIMALMWAGIALLMGFLGPDFFQTMPDFLASLLVALPQWGIIMNFFLMFFNLMPIPPLDGFSILLGILPYEMAAQLEPLRRYGLIILLLAVFILPSTGILNPISGMFELSFTFFLRLVTGDYLNLYLTYF